MTFELICPGCRASIVFSSSSRDRPELAAEKGEVIRMTCPYCHTTANFHVDDVVAVENKIVAIIASTVLVGGLIVLFVIIPRYITWVTYVDALLGIIMIPFMLYQVIIRSQRTQIETFNRHKVKGVSRDLSFKRRWR